MKYRTLAVTAACITLLTSGSAYGLRSDARQPINVRAHNVEANEKTGVSVYRGNVVLTQGSMRLEADRMEVTLRDGRTDIVRAWGQPVRIQSRSDKGEELRARATRAIYRATEQLIDLYGAVELKRNDDIFTGAAIHYSIENQTFTAEADKGDQVEVIMQPANTETSR